MEGFPPFFLLLWVGSIKHNSGYKNTPESKRGGKRIHALLKKVWMVISYFKVILFKIKEYLPAL